MYYLVYGILYLFSLLPFFVLYGISDFAFFIIHYILKYRRKVVMNNLSIVFPEKSEDEKKKIARKFYKNLTDTFIETIKMISISDKRFRKMTSINLDEVVLLAKKGHSIQFMAGHQFNWELANWLIAERMPIPFVGVYMRIKNEAINKIFYDLRSRKGTVLVAATEFRNKMHQLLNTQYSIGLAADQNPGTHAVANWLYFFGRPTPFVSGPDKAAIRNNCAVVFVKLIKEKRGQYKFECKVLTESGGSLQPGELTRIYRDTLEDMIRAYPDNYLWSHRRWKAPYQSQYECNWIDNVPAPKMS